MHQSSQQSLTLPAAPSRKRRGGFISKRRTAYVGLLAALVGGSGMAFAGAASAHTLTADVAEAAAKRYAQSVVNDPRTPYTFGTARCDANGVPHIRACWVMYDTPATRPTTQWACTERIDVFYAPHNAGDPPPNYTPYLRRPAGSHPC